MKIGPLEVSISTIVYAAVLLALVIFIPSYALSHYPAMRESWYRDTIINSITEGGETIEAGITACKALIAADPAKAAPRMYLGCLLCNNRNYKEAREAFDGVLDAAKATDEDKSLALTAAACAACLDGSKDGKPEHLDEGERLLLKALSIKETPDALGTMAIVKSWLAKNEAEGFVKKAFAAEPAPAPALLEQLYKLQGSILSRNHKPAEAGNAFRAVKAVNPDNTQMENNTLVAGLEALTAPGTEPAARRALIEKTTLEVEKFGKGKADAMMAIGTAWQMLKKEPDYDAPNGPFDKARTTFRQMIDMNPKESRAYRNLATMLEERIAELAAQLSVPVTGLNGEAPRPSVWDTSAGAGNAQPH